MYVQWHIEVTCEQQVLMPGRPWEPRQGDLFLTKHGRLLKVIKIANENHAAALLRTAFLLSPCLAQCRCDPAAPRCFLAQIAPLISAGPGGRLRTATHDGNGWQDQGSAQWQLSPASAVRESRRKRHFWWNSWSGGDLLNQCNSVHAACSVWCC